MKPLKTDKAIFDKGLGLSCVENYLLYILAAQGVDYRPLYAQSFIPVSEIVSAFCEEGVRYAYFYKIQRLQDLASDLEAVILSSETELDAALSNYDYCCVKVTPGFVADRYGLKLWRDDHYLLICEKSEDGFICVNDTPKDIVSLRDKEFRDAFGGRTICFNIRDGFLRKEQEAVLLQNFKESVAREIQKRMCLMENLELARDILGILRIARKRIREYCSLYFHTDFMMTFLANLDKYYAIFEYMRLRGRTDYDKVNHILNEIQDCDFEIINTIKQRMEMAL
jgi:hypothetical protein